MAFDKLEGEKQQQWMALSDVHATTAGGESRSTPGGILRTNAFEDADRHANLYQRLSRMNHSCAPNAHRLSTDNRGGVAVVASQDIVAGEEVLISYMDGADGDVPVEERRARLRQQYHFQCTCALCLKQEKATLRGGPDPL